MNYSNADASVNSVEAGIRGLSTLAGGTAAGCKQHWRELFLLYPSVSQMSCHIHVNASSVRT
jgi:hypothetical protein